MTANQVAYYNATENARHNLATENETRRANLAGETIKRDTLSETARSNLVNEDIKRKSLDESIRSNRANEAINAFKAQETQRSNKANENIKWGQLAETTRSNVAKETENTRANKAREEELKRSNEVSEAIRKDSNRLDAAKFYSNPDNMIALNLGVTQGAFNYDDPNLNIADNWVNGGIDSDIANVLGGVNYVTQAGGGIISSVLRGLLK